MAPVSAQRVKTGEMPQFGHIPRLPILNNPFFLCIPLVLPFRAIILEISQFITHPAGFKKEVV